MKKNFVIIAIMSVMAMSSHAKTFSFMSKKTKNLEYSFEVPESVEVQLKNGEPHVLGEGSMGIAIRVLYHGKQRVLKYFKTNEFFTEAELETYARLARTSVRYPRSLNSTQWDFLNKAEGAAEDVVFDAQQREERRRLLELAEIVESSDHQFVFNDFGVGSIFVIPETIRVTITSHKGGWFESSKTYESTGLIKPLLGGRNLKDILEDDSFDNDGKMVSAIINEIIKMSASGMYYDDLNEANWFIKKVTMDEGYSNAFDRYVAVPFDMKPGVYVGSVRKATIKNLQGVLNKVSPYGLSSGSKRRLLVAAKQMVGLGLYHAHIKFSKNRSIEQLHKQIRFVIDGLKD